MYIMVDISVPVYPVYSAICTQCRRRMNTVLCVVIDSSVLRGRRLVILSSTVLRR